MNNEEQNAFNMKPVSPDTNIDNSVTTEPVQTVETPQPTMSASVDVQPVAETPSFETPAPAPTFTAPVAPVESSPVEPVVEAPVESTSVASATEQPVQEAPVAQEVTETLEDTPNVAPEATPEVTTPVDSSVPTPNGNEDKGNKVFVIIVVVLVLVIGVLGVMVLLKGKGGNSGSTTTTTTNETFTKENMTTDINKNSTTRQTYNNTNNYTTSTRSNRSDADPQSVKQNSSVLKVDNYEYNLAGGDMVVYNASGQYFIYDTKDDAEIIVDIYNGRSTKEVIPYLQELADKRYEQGFTVVEGNHGTLSGIEMCYLLLSDDQYIYYEFYMNTGYGDLARYTFMSKKKYTVDSVAKLLYELNSVAVKKNTGTASAGLGDSLKTNYFDERLLSE